MVASTATTDPAVGGHHPADRSGSGAAPPFHPDDGPVVLAIDIGGTKVAAALVDGHGSVGERASLATPDSDDADVVFDAVAAVVEAVRTGSTPSLCGVGCGGPMTAGGEAVSPLNIPAWRGFPLRRRIGDLVGLPVSVDNDAKALALGEGWRGAARGVPDYLGMVVSTGVGGGIVLDGRLLDIVLPQQIPLKVVDTVPPARGDLGSSWKEAKLETGLQIMVPLFIVNGDIIRVDTVEKKYLGKE